MEQLTADFRCLGLEDKVSLLQDHTRRSAVILTLVDHGLVLRCCQQILYNQIQIDFVPVDCVRVVEHRILGQF